MNWLRRFFASLFAKPAGTYVCPACGERTADSEGNACLTCEMAVL